MAPEHKRLLRYPTMELKEIMELPVPRLAAAKSHLYLWVPNALLQEGLQVMEAWGFTYKSNLIWYRHAKTVDRTAVASVFISAMLPRSFCLVFAAVCARSSLEERR